MSKVVLCIHLISHLFCCQFATLINSFVCQFDMKAQSKKFMGNLREHYHSFFASPGGYMLHN